MGCLFAGCCHGCPARRGVCYGATHVERGFPSYLAGRPLVPVQALEAIGAAVLVLGCALLVPHTPGAAFGVYVTGYALLRFGLEELRGDPGRRYWHRLSEAQWTSLAVVAAMCVLAALDLLPALTEHLAALGILALAAAAVARRRPRSMLHPRYVRELAARLPVPRGGPPGVMTTSFGLRMSAGCTSDLIHYTVSRARPPLRTGQAGELARLFAWLSGFSGSPRVVPGAAGAYHVLFGVDNRPAP